MIKPIVLGLPLLLCSEHPPYYSFRLHSLQPSEEPLPFLKLLFVLKTKPHELVKTGASQQDGKDERLKTRRMKSMNKVSMRRRLSYKNIRGAGAFPIKGCVV